MAPVRQLLRGYGKLLAGLLLAIAVIVGFSSFHNEIQEYYLYVLSHSQENAVASYAFFLAAFLFAALTSTFPLSIICVMAGAIFGMAKGFLLTGVGIVLAGSLAFAISRYFFRSACLRLARRAVDTDKIERRIARDGWRYAILVRLAPVAPFGITSYCLGLTSITTFHYVLCTAASFPFLFACVYIGTIGDFVITSGNKLNSELLWKAALLFTGLAAVIAVVMVAAHAARRSIGASSD